ncbi:GATA-type zinc finger protein 1 isoform X2 [Alosa sapidissima]|uniref:GATA-type zinc finger protein 1 isoform X2 n=1 Tax=Alosa sapidissima TaxID=34773 RepID=UPI001C0A23F7|nr:GATA-type zinc finger protein 1 isoform X2 [Alosa sapidissima]
MSTRAMNSQASMNGTYGAMDDIEAWDHQVSQSSILYLLQEASKLALPAKALDYPESGSAKVPCENSEQKQPISSCLCPSQFPDGKSGEGASQPSFSGSFSLLHACEGSSPWEVMSLINQQCERLLHSGQADGQEEDSTAVSTNNDPSDNLLCPSSNSIHAEESECRENSVCSTSALSLAVSEIRDHCSVVSHSGETDIVKEEALVVRSTETIPQHCAVQSAQDIDNRAADAPVNLSDHNYSFSVSTTCRLLSLHQEQCAELPCSEAEVVASPCTKSPPQSDQRPTSDCQVDRKLSHSPSRKGAEPNPGLSSVKEPGLTLAEDKAFKPSPGFSLDCNNNVKPHSPVQTKPPRVCEPTGSGISSATLELSLPTGLPTPDHKSLRDQEEGETTKAQTQPRAAAAHPSDNQRSRTPRKQAHPCRSVDPRDPNLQGVIFSMNSKLDDSSNQCRLLITSNYRKELRKRACGGRRCRALRLPREASSSEEECESYSLSKSKTCASCCTRKTPLWRDAEDGTPLCNACGIRYKKYRVRCTNCWHIPRKDGKSRSQCFKCGDVLRLTSTHKRAGW